MMAGHNGEQPVLDSANERVSVCEACGSSLNEPSKYTPICADCRSRWQRILAPFNRRILNNGLPTSPQLFSSLPSRSIVSPYALTEQDQEKALRSNVRFSKDIASEIGGKQEDNPDPVQPQRLTVLVNEFKFKQGGFATVYCGRWNDKQVAIKVIFEGRDKDSRIKRRYQRELKAWLLLNHENIAPLLGVAKTRYSKNLDAMVSLWYEDGSAEEFLKEKGARVSLAQRLKWSLGVARGLEYLHNLQPTIIHGDLKPSNTLIDREGNIRICDFGLCRIVADFHTGTTTSSLHVATVRYAPPERIVLTAAIPRFVPTASSDVYSLGSTIYNFHTDGLPYATCEDSLLIISEHNRNVKPATRPLWRLGVYSRLWDLFERCWEAPNNRPSASEVKVVIESFSMDLQSL